MILLLWWTSFQGFKGNLRKLRINYFSSLFAWVRIALAHKNWISSLDYARQIFRFAHLWNKYKTSWHSNKFIRQNNLYKQDCFILHILCFIFRKIQYICFIMILVISINNHCLASAQFLQVVGFLGWKIVKKNIL